MSRYLPKFFVLISCCIGQSAVAATAVDDVYDATQLQTITSATCGVGYILNPDPLLNDIVTALGNVDRNQFLSSVSAPVSGTGLIQQTFVNDILEYVYFPMCTPAGDGTITQPGVFDYTLFDGGDQTNDTGRITINAISQPPTTVDDTYDVDSSSDISASPGPGTGQTTYALLRSPFANDSLNTPYDQNATLSAQDNFTVTSGAGSFQAFVGQSTLVFQYVANAPITSAVTIRYDLRDIRGASIPNTGATILINPPAPTLDAMDDTVSADQLQSFVDPTTGNVGYRFSPLANDAFLNNDPANLDLTQTLADSNFVRTSGAGSIRANNNNGIEFVYFPEGAFTQTAVFNYTLYDLSGNTDSASITINPPGAPPVAPPISRKSDIEDACAVELANQRVPAICDNGQINAAERMLSLSTISAQADALFGMQSDQIANIRQRMTESRSVYNPASVAGLNSNLFGESVPIGQIVQALFGKVLNGGGAADDFLDSGRLGFFINGNFSAGDRDETGLTGGYDNEGYNLTSGIDYRVNFNFIIGGAVGVSEEDTEFVASRGDQSADITTFSFYGNYFPSDSFYADWLLMLTQGDLNIDRNISIANEVAEADTEGDLWSFASTVGYHWNSGSWEMDGYGRVEYTDLTIDAYVENGSSFDLSVEEQEAKSLEAALGAKIAKVFSLKGGVIIPSLDVEWLNQFEDDARFIGVNMEQLSTNFAVQDEAVDNHYFNAALSLSSVFSNGFSAYLRVESQLGDEHLGRATYGGGLRWEF